MTVLTATLAVTVFGAVAVSRLPVELLPDLSYPTLTVQAEYPDAAPISVEQFVTRPIEEAVGVIAGLREMRSTSRPGLSEVVLEFEWDEPMDAALLEVREKLGLVDLPREVDPPRVLRYDPSLDPIVRLALTGERSLDDLRQVAERWIKPRLEAVRGVAAAKVRGGLDPEIQVEVDEDRLAALGLTLGDVAEALRSENINQPGGTIKDWGSVYLVRTLHEFDDLDQLRRTVVRETPAGRVRVEDVARVTRGHRDRDEITRAGGQETVELAIHREGTANTIRVAEDLRVALEELRGDMADDLSLEVLADHSAFIREAVAQVWSAGLIGGLLAVLVLYFFLRDPRPTAIVALSIPVSVLATFLPMFWAGVTLNIMSLGGLALGVGMLVDNSIVVLEAIDRRRRGGRPPAEAAGDGAREVAAAVTASTATTLAVFFPIVFVRGIAGQLFYDLSVTVCVSLLASLVVALTVVPSLAGLGAPASGARGRAAAGPQPWLAPRLAASFPAAARGMRRARTAPAALLRLAGLAVLAPVSAVLVLLDLASRPVHAAVGAARPWTGLDLPPLGDGTSTASLAWTAALALPRLVLWAAAVVLGATWRAASGAFLVLASPAERAYARLESSYPHLVARALRHRRTVLAAAATGFAAALACVPLLGTSLVPDLAQGQFAFRLRMPEGTTLEATSEVVARVEGALAGDRRFARAFSVIGSYPSVASGRQSLGENLAQIDVILPPGAGEDEERAAVDRVRSVLAAFPALQAELVHPSVLTLEPPLVIRLFGEDLATLDRAALRTAGAVAALPGVADVSTTVEPGSPEIRLDLDRERLATLGVSAEEIGRSLQAKIRGDLVGKFREEEERFDVRVRAAESARDRATEIGALGVRLPGGRTVPVSAVARVEVDRGPAAVHRAGGARMAEVSARVSGADLGEILERARAAIPGLGLPAGVVPELAGQDREIQVSYDSLRLALGLALFLVYVVMAMQFESLLHPLVILVSVPLGIVGTVAALLVTRTPIDVLVLIGAVMLAGIVVNNAIVLVDAVNRRRARGEDLEPALVGAGSERLRPILMTTLTTVLALLPMALGLGAGDELRAPLAVAVIGGLSGATLLTLVVVPCVYRVFARGATTSPLRGDRAPAEVPVPEQAAP